MFLTTVVADKIMGKKQIALGILREMRGILREENESRRTARKGKRKARKRRSTGRRGDIAFNEISGDMVRLKPEPKRKSFDDDVRDYFGEDSDADEYGLPNFAKDSSNDGFPFAPSKKELKEIFRL